LGFTGGGWPHILIVGQRGLQTYQPHLLLRGLNVANAACHQGLEHWAAQVDLVKDDQLHQLGVRAFATFARDKLIMPHFSGVHTMIWV